MVDYRKEAPPLLLEFLSYHESIKGHSRKTVDEYFLDLRGFFHYILNKRGLIGENEADFLTKVDLSLAGSITLSDVYDYMSYLARDRARHPQSDNTDYGLGAAARARKVACIRSFYKFLTIKTHKLSENPVQDLDAPKLKKTLPRYLTLEQSQALLEAVQGPNQTRDYCILLLFLTCGLRLSELAALNLSDVRGETLRVTGKGNKERVLDINDACREALDDYIKLRLKQPSVDKNALFVSRNRRRLSVKTVQLLVRKYLLMAGLDASLYSTHKLRHTAATLMLQTGVDVRTLQEVLGHEHLNTTQIYTHVDNSELKLAAKVHPLNKKT